MPLLVSEIITNVKSFDLKIIFFPKKTQLDEILFLPLVFLDIMKVIASNNDCSHHLGTMAGSSQYTASYRNITSKWTFLVNIGSCKHRSKILITEIDLNIQKAPVILSKVKLTCNSKPPSFYNIRNR